MKKISFLAAVATSTLSLTTVFSQTGNVGINTETPQATLHVKGQPSNSSSLDGVIAPTLTGDQMASKTYTLAQTGAIVYSTAPAASLTGQVINVTAPGYYYFDGVVWQKVTNSNEAWLTRGNLGTNATTNYLGTNDNVDLVFRRNKLHGGFIGSTNTGLGTSSMPQNAPGTYNVAFGNAALSALTTGTNNVGLGAYSGNVLTSGAGNVLVGTSAGLSITSGGWNVFVGDNTGRTLTTGNVNVGLGNRSLRNSTTAFKNIAMGQSALENLTTGSYNVALGQAAGYRLTTENKNVMIGAQTGSYVTGENNVFIGTGAGRSNTVNTIETVNNRLVIHSNVNFVPNPAPGTENVSDLSASWTNGLIIGDFKDRWVKLNGNLQLNPTYNPSDATFTKTLVAKPDGTVGLGDPVVAPSAWLIGGNSNTNAATNFIGTTNSQDVVFKRNGVSAGWLNEDDNNTSFGVNSMPRLTGYDSRRNNTAIGVNSLTNITDGYSNTSLGFWTLSSLTSGASNTAVGTGTMIGLTTGNENSVYGVGAGSSLTTGSHNLFIGSSTGLGISTGDFNVMIGQGTFPVDNGSNQLALGNVIFGKNINPGDGSSGFINNQVDGMIGIATPYPTSTLHTEGSVATQIFNDIFNTNGNFTLGDKHHTFIARQNTVILPPASTCQGREYVIIYGVGTPSSIGSEIYIGGSPVSNFSISSVPGNRGITVQSDGTNWYATNVF